MAKLFVNKWGNWAEPRAVYKNIGGGWYSCSQVHHKHYGWRKHWPPSPPATPPGYLSWDIPGNYWWKVPWDVTSVYIDKMWAGGGGGGACNNNGDAWVGSGGGSGGWINNYTLGVVPLEVLMITVGRGGYGASYRFNSNYVWNYDIYGNPIQLENGIGGGNTIIYNGASIPYVILGGGNPGNQYYYGGTGGNPNGSQGGTAPFIQGVYGYTGAIPGGTNPPSIGGWGGYSHLGPGGNGGNGHVSFSYAGTG